MLVSRLCIYYFRYAFSTYFHNGWKLYKKISTRWAFSPADLASKKKIPVGDLNERTHSQTNFNNLKINSKYLSYMKISVIICKRKVNSNKFWNVNFPWRKKKDHRGGSRGSRNGLTPESDSPWKSSVHLEKEKKRKKASEVLIFLTCH